MQAFALAFASLSEPSFTFHPAPVTNSAAVTVSMYLVALVAVFVILVALVAVFVILIALVAVFVMLVIGGRTTYVH